jgi:uncharacterized membrane protein
MGPTSSPSEHRVVVGGWTNHIMMMMMMVVVVVMMMMMMMICTVLEVEIFKKEGTLPWRVVGDRLLPDRVADEL